MFRPVRVRRGRLVAPTPPPTAEADHSAFREAWADYVAWSDLDEDRLPGASPRGDEEAER